MILWIATLSIFSLAPILPLRVELTTIVSIHLHHLPARRPVYRSSREEAYWKCKRPSQESAPRAIALALERENARKDASPAKNAKVQYRICGVIWALACDVPKDSGEKFIPMIRKALIQHAKADLLLQQGFGAFGDLAVNKDDNKALIASDMVWKTVAQLGTKGGETPKQEGKDGKAPDVSASIVESGLEILSNSKTGNKKKAPPKKGVAPLAEARTLAKIMEKHVANANVQSNVSTRNDNSVTDSQARFLSCARCGWLAWSE
jgi:hypothetical protein